ncbi:MAG TPA: gluconokinase [bacterium]|nr:gluconokinase [bacterium]
MPARTVPPIAAAPSSDGALLTLDVGTSSVRCLAFDATGAPLPGTQAARSHEPRVTADGASELDAPALLETTLACLGEVAQALHAAGRPLLGVGVCTFWHAFLAVDAAGAPLTPIFLWNDTRAAGAAKALQRELDGPALHRRTGCVLHPSYLPARLRWLRETRPDVWRTTRRFVSFGEYLEQTLFGAARIGLSMASGTGLLDQDTLDWDAALLAHLHLTPERLSPLLHEHASLAGLTAGAAAHLPALREVPFFPALGDGACSNLGSGATRPELGALMVGTSAAVRAFFAEGAPPAPRGLWRYLLDERRALIGGAISNGGNLLAWLQRTLRLPALEALEAELAQMEPAGHGLTVLPFLAGERNPDYPLQAHGVIAGLTSATTPAQIAQAALESVAFRLAAIVERLRPAAPGLSALVASGGLLRSPTWVRMLADVLGLPLHVSTVAEASSRGAALLALEALGHLPAADRLPPPLGDCIEPDSARHARYAIARETHETLYRRLVQPGV